MTDLSPLSPAFHAAARDRIRKAAAANGLDGVLMLLPMNIAYSSGWYFTACERPMGLWLPVDGEPVFFIPELERENAEGWGITDIRRYPEFPGEVPAVLWMLDEIGRKSVAIDRIDGAILDAARDRAKRLELRDYPMEARYLKQPEELALIRAAAGFADICVARMATEGGNIIAQGGTEVDLLKDAIGHAHAAMLTKHKSAFSGTPMRVVATVHSGPRGALPHGAVIERKPQRGETVIIGVGGCLGGYHAESAATFVVGEMSAEQRRVMQAMDACFEAGAAALRPGALCCDVNTAALDELRHAGLEDAIRHRIGHGMGLEAHEAPWLSIGDRTPVAAGMVFSSEPGVYRPDLDGYRTIHTMICTDQGTEVPSRFQFDNPIDSRVLAV
jgi:Xaa-Pro aminopeptidase